MTIRLHLRGTKVLEVMEDLPELLVVAVAAIASVVKVADLPHGGRPTTLVWHRRRFRCRSCRATTTETHPLFAQWLTTRLATASG